MKIQLTPKTLHLLITKNWLVDSIVSLGSGYMTHLTYPLELIDPEVLAEVDQQHLQNEVLGEIIYTGGKALRRVAIAEVCQVNDFTNFFRFDLRLLEVGPFARNGIVHPPTKYQCYFYQYPA